MNKYLEYYQFHEKDEDGNTVCLYCIVKESLGELVFNLSAIMIWL